MAAAKPLLDENESFYNASIEASAEEKVKTAKSSSGKGYTD
jgi:hypothetical protein